MSMERATALVLRTTDWSETSRIATLWTRELGKVRALAKGGRRLKSSFDSALDLLTVCGIVLLRKSSESLDLLTEAQVVRRFARLREDLPALYAAYYVAELLADWTEDHDPHPTLFDQALTTLDALATAGSDVPLETMRFEMVFLGEMGYRPVLDRCATCQRRATGAAVPAFSAEAGGILCPVCRTAHRDGREVSIEAWRFLVDLDRPGEGWRVPRAADVRAEIRGLLGHYLTAIRGRPPRLLAYLVS